MSSTLTPTRTAAPSAPKGVAPPHMPPPPPGTGLSARSAAPAVAAAETDQRRWSPVVVGALAGPVAIGAGVLLQIVASGLAGNELLRPLRMVTVAFLGGAGLTGGSALLGLVVNVALGAALGATFGAVVSRLGATPRTVLIGALTLGAGVFAVDQLVLAPLLSEVLALRDPVITLAARLVFGAVLAIPFLPPTTSPQDVRVDRV